MDVRFIKLTEEYRNETIDILNYYIENTTSAYRAEKVSYDFFENIIDENVVSAYVIMNKSNDVIGFCTLEKYKNIGTFDELGDCMYFMKVDMTGKGIGREILALLENDAKQNGMKKIVVDISDENEKSIAFHRKNGFIEYGRLEKCWKKFGKNLGIVYMYKDLK
jgi:phosphinothricin acetyltransferase